MRKDLYDRKEEILKYIEDRISIHEISRRLKCDIKTLKSFFKRENIDYKGNQGLKGLKTDSKKKTTHDLIEQIKMGHGVANGRLRKRMLEEGLKEYKCEICGLSEWLGKPIQLELHHKDFNHHNTDLDNLQILCSNCHSFVHKYENTIGTSL